MTKMNKSQSGKLGGLSTRRCMIAVIESRKQEYSICPTTCTHCQFTISWEKRNNKFCNRSCAASYNNKRVVKRKKNLTDLLCNTKTTQIRVCKYCGTSRNRCESKWCNRPQLLKSISTNFGIDLSIHIGSIDYTINFEEFVKNLATEYQGSSLPLLMQKYGYIGDPRNFAKLFKHLGISMVSKKDALIKHHRRRGTYDNMDAKELYYRACRFEFSNYNDLPGSDLIKTHGWYHPVNNLKGLTRDHMFSIAEGFRQKIPPWMIKHKANCRLLPHPLNASKSDKCSITLDELKASIVLMDNGAPTQNQTEN